MLESKLCIVICAAFILVSCAGTAPTNSGLERIGTFQTHEFHRGVKDQFGNVTKKPKLVTIVHTVSCKENKSAAETDALIAKFRNFIIDPTKKRAITIGTSSVIASRALFPETGCKASSDGGTVVSQDIVEILRFSRSNPVRSLTY